MKKYISLWLILTLLIPVILFQITSIISKTTFSDVFNEFEIILVLIGFSVTISTMITCTKILNDKMK